MTGATAAIIPQGQRRLFTLSEAGALLPLLKKVTARSEQELFQLLTLMKNTHLAPEKRQDLQRRADAAIARWSAKMARLGVVPQGLWIVDFDMGGGFYCWKFGEEKIAHYHDYGASFEGRIPLEKKEVLPAPREEHQ